MTRTNRVRIVIGLVTAHAVVNGLHGVPHAVVPVPLAPWQEAVVGIAIGAVPIAGAVLLWLGRHRIGASMILLGGLASAAFGTYYHFLSATPDNVARVTGAWSLPFLLTALGVSLLAVATVGAAGWLLLYESRTAG